jgi:hypothetical protein
MTSAGDHVTGHPQLEEVGYVTKGRRLPFEQGKNPSGRAEYQRCTLPAVLYQRGPVES